MSGKKRKRIISFKSGAVFDSNELEIVHQYHNPLLPSRPAGSSWSLSSLDLPSAPTNPKENKKQSLNQWGALLPELILLIFEHLDPVDVFLISSTCKHWRVCLYSTLKSLSIDGSERGRSFKDTNLNGISVFDALLSLELSQCKFITQQAFINLIPMDNLRKLTLVDCPQVALVGVTYLQKFRNLDTLELDGTMVNTIDSLGRLLTAQSTDTDNALTFLFKTPGDNPSFAKNIKSLSLRKWSFGKTGLEALSSLPNITDLDLSGWKLQISPALAFKSCGMNAKLVENLASFLKLDMLDVSNNIRSISHADDVIDSLNRGRLELNLPLIDVDDHQRSLVVICDENAHLYHD